MTEPDEPARRADELKQLIRQWGAARSDLFRVGRTLDEAKRVLALVLSKIDDGGELANEVRTLAARIGGDRDRIDQALREPEEPSAPDDEPTAEQSAAIAGLSAEQIAAIDSAILAFLEGRSWTKVARVVAEVMQRAAGHAGIPDVYYSSRVRSLVTIGALESKGDLMRMRFSEVRGRRSGDGGA